MIHPYYFNTACERYDIFREYPEFQCEIMRVDNRKGWKSEILELRNVKDFYYEVNL